ncbi:glycerol-3-phosphate 1-O-acyltransferase PlsY [Caproiciproducens galactitolivorans]|uniref:Glycerol-3-phosphate acyltransferase n=1 Tax=Caproiciproducens galactitolivorans TaxID=642589 RepID=A0ABT4BTR3_9FIRM|nr:glycerol-3-phosphate 1-O-acyltransferase PlsY [Caproiciproducens galactitolivorans]MCY1714292.1 glycerol-3-phosphate 1-O-acyltransferase PlsY [Caproiciproducens galactitolivorans]
MAIISYLLGSISFSIIFTKKFNKVDIRSMGSGNAGATNVLRSVGTKAAIFTFIFDFAKGAVSVIIGKEIFGFICTMTGASPIIAQYGAYIAGVACVIGHIYPVYFDFKGGKGVLTSAAMIALIDWRVFLIVISVFIILFLTTRIVSLSSMSAAASFPVATFLITYFIDYRNADASAGPVTLTYVWVTSAIALIMAFTIIYEHRANIERIKNGTEKKLTINHKS